MKKIKAEDIRRKPPVSFGPLDDPDVLQKKSSVKADTQKTFFYLRNYLFDLKV